MHTESPALRFTASPSDVRRSFLSHEASVKSVGILYFLASCTFLLMSLFALFGESEAKGRLTVAVITALLACAYFQIGRWLRQLDPKAKTPATILAVIGLLGFPVGTLINGYILYLLHSEKGKTVMSEEYQQIVSQTPEIKYKTSIVVWIFLALLIALIGLVAVSAVVRK